MNIFYVEPLSSGFRRMKAALFNPFDIKKWFVVGFTAFLANLIDWPKGGDKGKFRGRFDCSDFTEYSREVWYWITDHPGWFMFIAFGIIFGIGIYILLTWISSRGKFMFLDNVAHDRSEVSKPWREYANLGNSLFVWRLIFSIVCFSSIIIYLGFGAYSAFDGFESFYYQDPPVMALVGYGIFFTLMILTIMYIGMLLDHFIIPIMYKDGLTAVAAWRKFFPLLSRYFINFFLYGLFIFFVYIIIMMLVFTVAIFTCCIGFVLLVIPYIGSVVLLPVSYTFRSFSLEFLKQFGSEYDLYSGDSGPGNAAESVVEQST